MTNPEPHSRYVCSISPITVKQMDSGIRLSFKSQLSHILCEVR